MRAWSYFVDLPEEALQLEWKDPLYWKWMTYELPAERDESGYGTFSSQSLNHGLIEYTNCSAAVTPSLNLYLIEDKH